jgi:tetratricopeptide (TPR) repeat protein
MMHVVLNVGLWALAGALGPAAGGSRLPWSGAAVARRDGASTRPAAASDARSELRKADELRRAIRGKGEERRAAVEQAAAAYAAVLASFPDAKEEVAMAAFRIGELKRSLGKTDEAREAFSKVVSSGGSRRLAARAVLETAHIHRRAKEMGKALESYRKAAVEFADEAGNRDDALYWIGVLQEQNKEYAKSREAWQAVADRGVDPLDRVRAFDRIALSHMKEGNRADAHATVEQARTALHDIAADPSTRGARVKRALDRMRAVRALEEGEGSAKKSAAKGSAPGGEGEDENDEDDDD